MNFITDTIIKAAIEMLFEFIHANRKVVTDYLRAEAAKTTNNLDDQLVGFVCDWIDEIDFADLQKLMENMTAPHKP